jgi:preprotein translocase subunit YajC
MMVMLLAFLPVILFMWYTSRSSQKKQRDFESKLKKGDQVVTQSGLVGKLVETGEGRHVRVEIAAGVKVKMLKTAIVGLDADDAASAKPKDEPGAASEKDKK